MKLSKKGKQNLKNERFFLYLVKDLKIDAGYQKESTMDFFGMVVNYYINTKYGNVSVIMTIELDGNEILWDRFGCNDLNEYEKMYDHLVETKMELLYNFIQFHNAVQNRESWDGIEDMNNLDLSILESSTGLFGVKITEMKFKDGKLVEE